jgi:glutamate-5-semialdehyde dehydrogenase
VPVIKHLDGNCHTYVDDPCDLDLAVKVVDNAKTQKYSPCNATESLLVARGVAAAVPAAHRRRVCGQGREMRCDAEAMAILKRIGNSTPSHGILPAVCACQTKIN